MTITLHNRLCSTVRLITLSYFIVISELELSCKSISNFLLQVSEEHDFAVWTLRALGNDPRCCVISQRDFRNVGVAVSFRRNPEEVLSSSVKGGL